MRTFLATIATALTLAFMQTAAHAHFIWATVQDHQVRFALLENVAEAPDAKFEKYVADLVPRCGNKKLTLGAVKEGARYAPLAAGQNVVVADSVIGAKEREGEAYLLVYHAKGAVSLAAADTNAKDPVELQAHREGQRLIVSLQQNRKPVVGSEIWVQWPGNPEGDSVKTDSQGIVRVPWAVTSGKSGFVGIRAMAVEKKTGEEGGKTYASIHHWTTLTFPSESQQADAPQARTVDALQTRAVDAPQAKTVSAPQARTAGVGDKPLTQILREAYGDNHDIVGNAAFNHTLFAGQLTSSQLEVHLQQRALIHNEVHRILNAAAAKNSVPYGAVQKNVSVLLFQDLIAMGSGWPTEAQARPLTRAFLQEIRDSEKQGPYFALGIFHVYYGGITNGGRRIGKKIDDTLHFLPTYYEQSDGYRDYLTEVNKITDSVAQQEMVRGGKAAYKYIIAISNEDIFQGKETPK